MKLLARVLIGLNVVLGLLLLDKLVFASPTSDTLPQTVLISNEQLGGSGRGTGVLLDATHVLTCAHMTASQDDTFFVYTYPIKHVYIGKLEYENRFDDLAILVLASSAVVHATPVFQETTYAGEDIIVIGNVLGSMKWYVTHGVIAGKEGPYLLTDASIHGGNSGGPWVNANSEIVALTDWTLIGHDGEPTGINGGISAKTINEFLEDWKNPNGALMQLLGLK